MDPEGPGSAHGDETALRAEFLARAHHDLKTPLAVLGGWLETFGRSWERLDDDERREAIQSMGRSLTDLSDGIDALLGEVRAEVLARDLRPSSVDVAAVAATVAQRLGAEVSVPEGIVVEVDRDALLNLLLHLAEAQRLAGEPDASPSVVTGTESGRLVVDVTVRGGALPDDAGSHSPAGVRLQAARRLAAAIDAELTLAATEDGSRARLTFASS